MVDPYDEIYSHCARTLPENLSDLKKLLNALTDVLAQTHPAQPSIAAQLAAIEAVEKLQSELPLKFAAVKKRRANEVEPS